MIWIKLSHFWIYFLLSDFYIAQNSFIGLIVQGRDTDKGDNSLHKFVKFFKLAWKKDDQTPWTNVDFVFATNLSDGTREQKVEFEVPIVAKYLKVIPEEWQHQTCMRIELLKCTKA